MNTSATTSTLTKGTTAMGTQSQFGIIAHAQIQSIEGRTFEFQPEHLLCDKCWERVDTAYAHASYYGQATASCDAEHGITVTKINAKVSA